MSPTLPQIPEKQRLQLAHVAVEETPKHQPFPVGKKSPDFKTAYK